MPSGGTCRALRSARTQRSRHERRSSDTLENGASAGGTGEPCVQAECAGRRGDELSGSIEPRFDLTLRRRIEGRSPRTGVQARMRTPRARAQWGM